MKNTEIADILEETAKLMELHGENPFRIRSVQRAAFQIERLPLPLEKMTVEEMENTDGIGKSLSRKIFSLIQTGKFDELEEMQDKTPQGVRDILRIKGLGPKKVGVLWKELQIESPGELLYACNENRLVELKGFGNKSQEQIRQSVEFSLRQKGFFHFAFAEKIALEFLEAIRNLIPDIHIELSGEIRRLCEIVSGIDYVAYGIEPDRLAETLNTMDQYVHSVRSSDHDTIAFISTSEIPMKIQVCRKTEFAFRQWIHTGSTAHLDLCKKQTDIDYQTLSTCASEEEIYRTLGLPFILPECREGRNEIQKFTGSSAPALIETKDLKGVLHNHTTYSDGKNTLLEMARACRDAGFEYFGVCDHSKSAFYAGGLSIEKVQQQQAEIKILNNQLAPFRIFSGIESDILTDGSLDYPDEILAGFDFIVASVHSGLRMDKEKATARLIAAIENPYTTILGHPTGRLLLSREGYPLDYEAIFKACAQHGVAIELNAHPYRLDLDWRLIEQAMGHGILISINPDAHATEGLHHMRYGVNVARKGFLDKAGTLNAKSANEIETWFSKKRQKAIL